MNDCTPMRKVAEELEWFQSVGRTLNMWWRDDDATHPTQEVERAVDAAVLLNIHLALAVIPAAVDPALQRYLAATEQVQVLQHGFSHANFEGPNHPKSEFGPQRKVESAVADIARGYRILSAQFGRRFLPVFVPPWNRIDEVFLPHLTQLGIRRLSTFGCRTRNVNAPLTEFNVHCDFINWST